MTTPTKHPTLYKKTSTGALQQWDIAVDGNVIITEWGQIGGTIQRTQDTIKEGKNIGRSNETTPEQQAQNEAKAQWEKKLKKDYVLTIKEAEDGGSSDLVAGGLLPMLAHRYDKYAEKITFPAYAQPKLDGHRCIAIVDELGKATLWSRTRKPIVSMPHIVAALEKVDMGQIVYDGELYNVDYRDKFEQLTSLIRPEYAKDGCEVVQYHIYDIAATAGPFSERTNRLGLILAGAEDPLMRVETIEVADEDELMAAFDRWVSEGYEGAIVRNKAGAYMNKRSYDLQKVKSMLDDEFKIIGVTEGRGKLAGHGIFVCATKEGSTFEVKMKGKLETLKDYWENQKDYVGRMLTVQYFGMTNAAGVPRFPVGLRFREDI